MSDLQKTPIHSLSSNYKINIDAISYSNSYDFKQIHKHDYYEILFFEQGGGYQRIDFKQIEIKPFSCYIVKPKQIHLVKREPQADGLLIQFTETMILPDVFFNSLSILNNYIGSSILFENQEEILTKYLKRLREIKKTQNKKALFFKQKTIHLLSNLLYDLERTHLDKTSEISFGKGAMVLKFSELVEENLNRWSIDQYSEALKISPKKLNIIVKQQFYLTPLKYIHRILILRIKRDLVFEDMSFKELSYFYNFDNPSNFSLFVKKHTGLNPSELQKKLMQF